MFSRPLPLFLLAVFASFAFLGCSPLTGHANPASFTLFGRIATPAGWGFTSTVMTPGPDLTVAPGEAVTLSLTSGDTPIGHNWGVDYNNNMRSDFGEPLSSTFSSSTTPTNFTFTATTTPGTYHYYCFIHLGAMVGRFMVLGPDFTIGANPATLGPLNNGTQGSSTINVSSISGFTGTVDLTVAPSSGLTANVNPMSIPGGSGTSRLTVSAASAGSYIIVVTGTSGSLSHEVTLSVSVAVTVTSQGGSGIGNLPWTYVIGVVVALIGAAAIAVFLVRRRRSKKE